MKGWKRENNNKNKLWNICIPSTFLSVIPIHPPTLKLSSNSCLTNVFSSVLWIETSLPPCNRNNSYKTESQNFLDPGLTKPLSESNLGFKIQT